MTNSTAVMALTPALHTMFRGDVANAQRTIAKKGATQTLNGNIKPRLVNLKTSDLVPLESQRTTKEKWTTDRLTDLGGLDMWAFGTLSVCFDSRDQTHYVWDGCGRLALAQLHGLEEVPCIVIEGAKEQAAFYFGFCQEKGRRTLSKEVLFVNRAYSGDEQAIKQVYVLDQLGLYIKGDTDYAIPNPTPSGHVEIGYRAFNEGVRIADDMTLARQARDMIVTAWSNNPNGCTFINQDIFWAVIRLLKVYPELRNSKHQVGQALQQFLNQLGGLTAQKNIDWKPPGLSGNSGVATQLAYGLLKAFRQSSYWKDSFNNGIRNKRIEDLL